MAAPATTQHQCLIYEGSPASQLPAPAPVAKQRLEAGSQQLVLDSPAVMAGFRSRLVASGVDEADAVYKGALNLSSGQANDNTGAWTTDIFAEAVYTSLKQTEKWTASLKCDLQSQGDKFWRPNRLSFLGVCAEP